MTMNRNQLEESLVDYLYDELDPTARAAFERSVVDFPDLAAEVAAHRRTRDLMQDIGAASPPANFTMDAVRAARIEAHSEPKASFWDRLWAAFRQPGFAAVTVFVAVAGVSAVLATDAQERHTQLTHERARTETASATRLTEKAPATRAPAPLSAKATSKEEAPAPAVATPSKPTAPPVKVASAPSVGGVSQARMAQVTPKDNASPPAPGIKHLKGDAKPSRPVINSRVADWRFVRRAKKAKTREKTKTRSVARKAPPKATAPRRLSGRLVKQTANLRGGKKASPAPPAKPVAKTRAPARPLAAKTKKKTRTVITLAEDRVGSGRPALKRAAPRPAAAPMVRRKTTTGSNSDALYRAYRAHLKNKRWAEARKTLARLSRLPGWAKRAKVEKKRLARLSATKRHAKAKRAQASRKSGDRARTKRAARTKK